MPEHVLAQAARHRTRLVGFPAFVDIVRKLQQLAIVGKQSDVEIARIDQFTHHLVDAAVELVLADIRRGQLRDLEQCRLQPLGALAFDDFQLQAPVGLGQFQRALPDAAFEVVLVSLALQRGEDVAADELHHRLVLGRIYDARLVALQHDRPAGHAVAQQRYAHPVMAVGADQPQRLGGLRAQLRAGSAQRSTAAQHMPGQRVLQCLQGHRVERPLVVDIDEVQKPDDLAIAIEQHDEKVFGNHQRADDGVDALEQIGHVAVGAGQVGDGEQGALHLFGMFQPRQGAMQFDDLQCAAQALVGHLQRFGGQREHLGRAAAPVQFQQHHRAAAPQRNRQRRPVIGRQARAVVGQDLAGEVEVGTNVVAVDPLGRLARRRVRAVQPPQHAPAPAAGQGAQHLGSGEGDRTRRGGFQQ